MVIQNETAHSAQVQTTQTEQCGHSLFLDHVDADQLLIDLQLLQDNALPQKCSQ